LFPVLAKLILLTSFILALCTVFIIDNRLAYGVVYGIYFWFYGSMGLVAVNSLQILQALPLRGIFGGSVSDGAL